MQAVTSGDDGSTSCIGEACADDDDPTLRVYLVLATQPSRSQPSPPSPSNELRNFIEDTESMGGDSAAAPARPNRRHRTPRQVQPLPRPPSPSSPKSPKSRSPKQQPHQSGQMTNILDDQHPTPPALPLQGLTGWGGDPKVMDVAKPRRSPTNRPPLTQAQLRAMKSRRALAGRIAMHAAKGVPRNVRWDPTLPMKAAPRRAPLNGVVDLSIMGNTSRILNDLATQAVVDRAAPSRPVDESLLTLAQTSRSRTSWQATAS